MESKFAGKKPEISKVVALLLFLVWCVVLTNVFYEKLVPRTDTLTVSRENKHRVLARQDPFVLEMSGGIITPNQDDVSRLKSEITDFLVEVGNVNSFPFVAKWLLKFDVSLVLKSVSVKDSTLEVTPEVLCNNMLSPDLIVFTQRNIYLQDFRSEIKTSLPEILNSCAVNLSKRDGSPLPDEYVAIESYALTIKPASYRNHFILSVISVLSSFALLPVLREGVKFCKMGFSYFT